MPNVSVTLHSRNPVRRLLHLRNVDHLSLRRHMSVKEREREMESKRKKKANPPPVEKKGKVLVSTHNYYGSTDGYGGLAIKYPLTYYLAVLLDANPLRATLVFVVLVPRRVG